MLTFAILICAVGLYVAVAPVRSDWNPIQNSAAAYDFAIADLQTAVKGAVTIDFDYAALATTRSVMIPDSTKNWMHPEKKEQAKWNPGFFEFMSDAAIMQFFETELLLPRPTFSLGSSVRAHPWSGFGGLALFISGLSVLGWLFRRTRVETRSWYAVP